MSLPLRSSRLSLAERIRAVLATRGLSLADISRASRSHFSGNSLHHIPHNFYDAVRKRDFSPSLYQLVALSTVSDYRLIDWFELFGFSLDDVPRFQASFPSLRTVELDARVYHPNAQIPWFQDLRRPAFSASLLPLSKWLIPVSPQRFDSLSPLAADACRYVKIGSQDALAFPDLLPGSIVRVNSGDGVRAKIAADQTPGDRLFLVEHSRGLACSRLYRSKPNRVVLCSKHLPYAPVELEEGTQTTVLGVADLEIRPLASLEQPSVPLSMGQLWTPAPLPSSPPLRNVGEFIRRARKRSGLSFRAASERTRTLAQALGDSRYFCAAGSLSDYEAGPRPPRHIHKLISICSVYFARVDGILEASGVGLDRAGNIPMPDQFLRDSKLPETSGPRGGSSYFLEEMERRYAPLPYFLHKTAAFIFQLPDLSVRDIFWAGGVKQFVHPSLSGALFLVIDRKKKRPRASLSSPVRAQPLYVVLQRDGKYLCGSCCLHEGMLVVRPWMAGLPRLIRLRNRAEAEVVGKVVGIVRRLQ